MSSDAIVISPLAWLSIAVQAGWLAWALINFIRRNDEWPVVVAAFLAYCGSYRFLTCAYGLSGWVDLGSLFEGSITINSAATALALITFGESVFLISYRVWQNKILVIQNQRLPAVLADRLRWLLIFLTITCLPVILWTRYYTSQEVAAGKSLAFQVSAYAQLFPMVAMGLAIFVFLAWRFGALRDVFEKGAAVVVLLVIAYLTYGPYGRFTFLGWMIGGSYIVSTRWFGRKRLPILLAGGVITLILFGVAGAMRNLGEDATLAAGMERTTTASDANMLDGMVLLMQVYPKMLPYEYGAGHLEILERPIPRALWPGKPVGGYMNKLGIFDAESAGTTGISPTLFGSFYQEGGWVAVFIFSVIYGWVAAWIIGYSSQLRPVFGVLIRACVLGGMVPLLRGGDLPGIYAWLGMAFWPVLLFLWWNREYLRPQMGITPGKANRRQRNRTRRAVQNDPQSATPFSVTAPKAGSGEGEGGGRRAEGGRRRAEGGRRKTED